MVVQPILDSFSSIDIDSGGASIIVDRWILFSSRLTSDCLAIRGSVAMSMRRPKT
jgi:hypothetical protein